MSEQSGVSQAAVDAFYGSAAVAEPPSEPDKVKPAESEPAKLPSEAETPAETAPESEPGDKSEEKKELTPEERSKRDREYQERRQAKQLTRLNRELGEQRALARQLQQQIAELSKGKTPESAPGTTGEKEPEFQTFEERDKWIREQAQRQAIAQYESQRQQREAEAAFEAAKQAWQKKAGVYVKAHPDADFETAFQSVATEIDSVQARDVADWIKESELGPGVIVYLNDHDDELAELLQASGRARMRLFDAIEDKVKPAPPKKITQAPKAPLTVSGNSTLSKPKTAEDVLYG